MDPVPVAAGVLDAAQDRRQRLSSLDGSISRKIISNDWALVRCYIMTAGEMLSCNKYGSVSRVGEEGALPFLQLWLVIPQSNTTCCVNVL